MSTTPEATRHQNSPKYWFFYPSEAFSFVHFNMIHPVCKNKFMVQHKKFGPAQNILGSVKGQFKALVYEFKNYPRRFYWILTSDASRFFKLYFKLILLLIFSSKEVTLTKKKPQKPTHIWTNGKCNKIIRDIFFNLSLMWLACQ